MDFVHTNLLNSPAETKREWLPTCQGPQYQCAAAAGACECQPADQTANELPAM